MDDAAPGSGRQPIGAYLSAHRRLRGITIEELSAQTRIPLRSLERLEAGSFDAATDGFIRGFVRTVAEALGLDPDETLNRTLEEPGQGLHVARRLSLGRVLSVALGVALLVAVGFGAQRIAISLAGEASGTSSMGVTLRRDPIRALAEAQGVAALTPAPALALASTVRASEEPSNTVSVEHERAVVAPATR